MSTVYLGGWGRSTWGFGAWNEASVLPVLSGSVGSVTTVVRINVLGVSGTGQVDAATTTGFATAPVTGVVGTSALATTVVNSDGNISALGLNSIGSVGTVSIASESVLPITGVVGNTAIGVASTRFGRVVNITGGVSSTGSVGSVTVNESVALPVVGVLATGQLGTVTLIYSNADISGVEGQTNVGTATASVDSNIPATGVSSTGASGTATTTSGVTQPATSVIGRTDSDAIDTVNLGTVSIKEGASATVTGVQATGQVGQVLVWSKIVPIHNSNWAPINTNSTVIWKKIAS